MMFPNFVFELSSGMFGALLISSGVMKIRSPLASLVSINVLMQGLLRVPKVVVTILAGLEIVIGTQWLVVSPSTYLGLAVVLATMFLFLIFSAVLVRALKRGVATNCGCFGAHSAGGLRPALFRNILLVVLLAAVLSGLLGRLEQGGLQLRASGPMFVGAALALASISLEGGSQRTASSIVRSPRVETK